MISRPGSYRPQAQRPRPLDQILNPQLPTSPATGGVGTTGQITGPVPPRPLTPGPGGGGFIDPSTLTPEQRTEYDRMKRESQARSTGLGAGKGATPEGGGAGGVGGEGGVGEENPWLNPFMEVYETTKTGAMKNLEEMQKGMAERFAHRGGYFGGEHAIGQGKMAAETGTALDQLLSQVSLTASEREHQDWLRAREEEFKPMDFLSMLLGQDTFENIVQQPGESPWGDILSSLIAAGGTAIASSKEFKKDISGIEEEEENRIFEQMKKTPLFNYRYKFEPDNNIKHVGLITEESPEELTLFNKKAVGLYEYISMLHATIKVMSRKIEKLEGRN